MKRSSLNFIVDLAALLTLVGLAFTGFIMKYILPPGSGGGLGRSFRGGRNPIQIKELWSMSRHEWGDVHFYLAVLFVVLICVHIALHWGWIKRYFKSLFVENRQDG